ncbi:hypothetical protein Tco_0895520 [Tanacetum coccineum]|uniref:Uncharacterized protein n=1 Tax=Tanacetum coccineum TaxID=301880 RepID=A0ABQ5CG17_9ASTR
MAPPFYTKFLGILLQDNTMELSLDELIPPGPDVFFNPPASSEFCDKLADREGLNKVASFEVVCWDLNIVPTVTLFRVFQCLCKQGDWFSFSKRRNTEDVCMDDDPSSLKKWKDEFFLIDHRTIPDHLKWRHSCSCVSDDLPTEATIRMMRRLTTMLVGWGVIISIPSWSDAKVVEESHHLSLPLLELKKRASEAGSSAPELDQAEGVDETELADLCAEFEDSLERDEGVYTRVVSVPIPRLGNRLGAPPSIAIVSASEPSYVGTLAHACTSGRSLSLGGAVVSGHAGKSGAEVMLRQLDLLDSLARSALDRVAEYDQILNDDFCTATRGEEINLTLFPLAPGPYHMPYPYQGVSYPLYTREEKALDQTITPAELRRTKFLLPLELSNRGNVLSALLVSHGYELNSRYTYLENRELHSQRYVASKEVKKLESQLTDAKAASVCLSEELTRTDVKLSEQALTVRDLQNELALERSKSRSYKDFADELRAEVVQFIGSGVEGLVRRLLSSDEFHAAVARFASLGANVDFDKALVDFPTTLFPFLGKVTAAAGGTLSDVVQILPDKFSLSATPVSTAPSGVNEAPDQVPL